MTEIILPPEENEETPQVPELNIDKPSGNSKIITIEFEAKKTNKVSTKDTNQQLYTTDTDAWFEFKETSLEGANGIYSVVFRNRHDGSIFQRTGDVVNGIAYYKIPHQEIRHAGAWRGQIVYTLSNGDTTAREFDYDVKGHILDGKDVREIVVEDFETLMSQLRSMKDNAELELADLVNAAERNELERQQMETDRQSSESDRVNAESQRNSNETGRISAESERVSAESERSVFYDGFDGEIATIKTEIEKKANRKQEDWITPTLLNGATGDIQYRKNDLNELRLKGAIQNAGTIDFANVARIPSSYRPQKTAYLPSYAGRDIYITPTGLIYARTNNENNTSVWFDGLNIPLDQEETK